MAQYTINDIPASIDWECSNDFVRRTLQNAKNLLCTRVGEVPYQRNRGIDPAIYDMSGSTANEYIFEEVRRVLAWEPDIENVISAELVYGLGDEDSYITAVVEINEEQ